MTLLFEEEGDFKLPIECIDIAKGVILASLEYESFPYEVEVSLLLTMNEEIREMNWQFREINHPTDVLSFPMIDYAVPGAFDFLEGMTDCFHPESGEVLLGDIVISKEKVIQQAEDYGHSVKREFAFLIAHSMLHLMGYDHIESGERIIMEDKQRKILERLHITR
ncbi:rRNA maturation RNase YbeY [Lachnospiraceae bacterium LCP25S3_G4]